jgi:hypothetical protein
MIGQYGPTEVEASGLWIRPPELWPYSLWPY